MKHLFLLMCMVLMTACTQSSEQLTTSDGLVDIRLGGDIEITQGQLTRGFESANYFAFEIDEIKNGQYIPFAEGLFNSPMVYQVALSKSSTYRFRVVAVQELNDALFISEAGELRAPFTTDGSVKVTNSFCYGTDKVDCWSSSYFSIYNGNTTKGKVTYNPSINYYVGEAVASGDGSVTVEMHRRNIAIKFNIVPPVSGRLSVRNVYSEPYIDYQLDSDSDPIDQTLFYAVPLTHNYEYMKLEVIWTDKQGNAHDYSVATKELPVNSMTTVNIDLSSRMDAGDVKASQKINMRADEGLKNGDVINID